MRKISRRHFLYSSGAFTIAARSILAQETQPTASGLLLVGTQTAATSKGIYAYNLDAATGDLTQIGLATESENPTFLALAPNGTTVFVANEIDQFQGKSSGAVSSYALDRKAGTMTRINQVASGGAGPCHVAVDHTGRAVFAANYGGGSVASFKVGADGTLSSAVSFQQYTGQGPDKDRQTAPHAHRVTVSPDNRFLLVNDLGLDQIHVYRLVASSAKITSYYTQTWKSAPGAGPRALVFNPNGTCAYCVTEMMSTVDVLKWHKSDARLETIQVTPMPPEGFQGKTGGADIVLDKPAKFAYAIDRFDDIVVTFSISPRDGKLTLITRTPCGGKVPRHLALDPAGRWLLIANQESDDITVFSRDPDTGTLGSTPKSFQLSRPQCLVFA